MKISKPILQFLHAILFYILAFMSISCKFKDFISISHNIYCYKKALFISLSLWDIIKVLAVTVPFMHSQNTEKRNVDYYKANRKKKNTEKL